MADASRNQYRREAAARELVLQTDAHAHVLFHIWRSCGTYRQSRLSCSTVCKAWHDLLASNDFAAFAGADTIVRISHSELSSCDSVYAGTTDAATTYTSPSHALRAAAANEFAHTLHLCTAASATDAAMLGATYGPVSGTYRVCSSSTGAQGGVAVISHAARGWRLVVHTRGAPARSHDLIWSPAPHRCLTLCTPTPHRVTATSPRVWTVLQPLEGDGEPLNWTLERVPPPSPVLHPATRTTPASWSTSTGLCGYWKGRYGGHGSELLHVSAMVVPDGGTWTRVPGAQAPPDMVHLPVAGDWFSLMHALFESRGGPPTPIIATTPSASAFKHNIVVHALGVDASALIVGRKITGDANVPSGQISFVADITTLTPMLTLVEHLPVVGDDRMLTAEDLSAPAVIAAFPARIQINVTGASWAPRVQPGTLCVYADNRMGMLCHEGLGSSSHMLMFRRVDEAALAEASDTVLM